MSGDDVRGQDVDAMPHAPAADPPDPTPAAHAMSGIERTVRRALVAGVAASAALMIAGLVLLAVRGGQIPGHVTPLTGLPRELAALDPAAYLSLGLVVLIFTPFVRVAGSVIAFTREGDRRYMLVTSVVLAVMCLSVLLGRA